LGMDIRNVPMIRKIITENYSATIVKNKKTSKLTIGIYKYEITPSGFKRPFLLVTAKQDFEKTQDAVKYANEQFLPGLELTEYWAKSFGVPSRALQMLCVKER